TLVDSYEAIGEALQATYAHYGLDFNEEWVMAFIIKESVKALLYQVAKEHHLDFAALSAFFKKEQEARDDKIKSIPHLVEVLAATKAKGINHFVYTNKVITVNTILVRLCVCNYIIDVMTSSYGFDSNTIT